jgi:hypothetical protein
VTRSPAGRTLAISFFLKKDSPLLAVDSFACGEQNLFLFFFIVLAVDGVASIRSANLQDAI